MARGRCAIEEKNNFSTSPWDPSRSRLDEEKSRIGEGLISSAIVGKFFFLFFFKSRGVWRRRKKRTRFQCFWNRETGCGKNKIPRLESRFHFWNRDSNRYAHFCICREKKPRTKIFRNRIFFTPCKIEVENFLVLAFFFGPRIFSRSNIYIYSFSQPSHQEETSLSLSLYLSIYNGQNKANKTNRTRRRRDASSVEAVSS